MMRPARLRTQLFPYSVAATAVALTWVTAYAVGALSDLHARQTEEGLLEKARLIRVLVTPRLADGEALQPLVRELGASATTRITIITAAGRVLADSEHDPASMADHSDRPEVRAALAGGTGRSRRFSQTLERDMLYVAVRAPEEGAAPVAVIRTALPLATLAETLGDTLEHMALVGLAAALLAAGLGMVVARRITRPIEELTRGAEAFAAGNLSHRLVVSGSREVHDLARAMNEMAEQLSERIETIDRQRDELEAVLESMVEGVVAVDADERVLRVNSACLRLLDVVPEHAQGRTLQEVLRNPELERLVAEILANGTPRDGEIHLQRGDGERTLEVHGAMLRDSDGALRGAVLALHDVTRTRRLERVRRDFVANVSHELRTPVTVIKGSVETLLDSARTR